jgi:hypothetical protein
VVQGRHRVLSDRGGWLIDADRGASNGVRRRRWKCDKLNNARGNLIERTFEIVKWSEAAKGVVLLAGIC